MGWLRPKVIASTARTGYGAIVSFDGRDTEGRIVAALAAKTPQDAMARALRKAKARGGHWAAIEAVWSDGAGATENLLKL
jgi:hypothetical protein